MSRFNHATIRNRIEESFTPVPRRMESDGEPQTSSASQREAEEQSDKAGKDHASPVFSRIAAMDETKSTSQQSDDRPESDASRQRELRIAAEEKIFEESYKQEIDSPECCETDQVNAVQNDVPGREPTPFVDRKNYQADRQETPRYSDPEVPAKQPPQRQAVVAPPTTFNTGENGRWDCGSQKIQRLLQHSRPQAAAPQVSGPGELNRDVL